MNTFTAQDIYAQLYDGYVFDWPGEMDFYRELIVHPSLMDHGILEVACSTGCITLQLAKEGINVTGLDLSPELLEVAKKKSIGLPNIQWIQGDMRDFELGKNSAMLLCPATPFRP